tara:strand:- start:85 stop:1041 length:957 start_codon:yes stop_codon:yes gene_type:complete
MQNFLDFEKPLLEIQTKIEELRHLKDDSINIANELASLQDDFDKKLKDIYTSLSPWQKVKICRHQDRPKFQDFVENIFDEFISLSGDRLYSEDFSLKGGIASINEYSCLVLGNDKGKDIDSRVKNNFGMAKPEGYRKAIRLMNLAEKFKLPVICFIDTPGAFPGVDAEDRGQSEAIANSIQISLELQTPMQSFIVGEGGSGGAIALATANEVIMLEHAIYSVISPEGCATILWKDIDFSDKAAESLCLTAQDLEKLGVIDGIIVEPLGGAHRNIQEVCKSIKVRVIGFLDSFKTKSGKDIVMQRKEKFLKIGREFIEN